MYMIIGAIILFLISAFFGAFILNSILKNKHTRGPVVFVHGIIAIFALFATIAYTAAHPSTLLIIASCLLVVAALGGFTLLTIDMSKKPIPKLFAILHPIIAGCGLLILFIYLYQLLNQG